MTNHYQHTHNTSPELWDRLKPLAREMRHEPTPAENRLWQKLRNRAIDGAKFRRQHAIGGFIVDFVCLEKFLIVEVDGDAHDGREEYDAVRTEYLESLGFQVVRFTNQDVLQNLYVVTQRIADQLNER